ncbi:hypothetical protein BDZ89DRAFT_1059485 [Hymenopellis radicata]|nr:hypothetical protein BDZ89DRAFT_1059485 [Hymenopellis radicata]
MAVSEAPAKKEEEAMRLRGGCIPCPVSGQQMDQILGYLTLSVEWRMLLHYSHTMLLLLKFRLKPSHFSVLYHRTCVLNMHTVATNS